MSKLDIHFYNLLLNKNAFTSLLNIVYISYKKYSIMKYWHKEDYKA